MTAPSLRRRLLLHLLGAFVVAWLILVVVVYVETTHEVEELFDAQLAQVAGLFAERVFQGAEPEEQVATVLSQGVYGHKYERLVGFQIWQDGALVLRSQSAPAATLAPVDGYSDQQVDGSRWRVFGYALGAGRRVLAGESYAVRDELTQDIALATLVPLLWALPVLAALVWIGIGNGLRPLRRVADQVGGRDPGHLEPLPDRGTPVELRPLVDALNALLARLREAFARERQFTADAAHELRTPLAGLRVQAEVARGTEDPAVRAAALAGVIGGVDRAARLVEQLLALARLDPERTRVKCTRVALAEVGEEVLADLFPLARQHGVELALEDAPVPGIAVDGEHAALYALLRNLVDNALRHSPAGGQVTVTVGCTDGRPWLAVSDQGPGIPVAERDQVFRRFYRGAAERGAAGAGLGLAIVQRLAELHQAEVRLADGPGGRGLRVEVLFPVTRTGT